MCFLCFMVRFMVRHARRSPDLAGKSEDFRRLQKSAKAGFGQQGRVEGQFQSGSVLFILPENAGMVQIPVICLG